MIGRHLQMFNDKIEVSVRSHEKALEDIEKMYNLIQVEKLEKENG